MNNRYILYSRTGCHLCEEMLSALRAIGSGEDFHIEVVNIDDDPALVHLYGARIPVLVSAQDNSVVSEHILDENAFMQSLE